ncbi:MAG: diacylglycerol/lipid kinase family protein [Candidatus Cyclobacteriaceae bacterium M3_2C_046]
MVTRKYLVVVNPNAGKMGPSNLIALVGDFFKGLKIPFEVFLTQPGPDAGLNQLKSDDLTDLLVIGGDGTINAVVNQFAKHPLPISIIPAGTGNDFGKNMGLNRHLPTLLKTAWKGKIKHVDLGLCNDRYFVNGLGIGFDGKVVEHMIKKRSPLKGHLAYLHTVLHLLLTFKEQRIEFVADDKAYQKKAFLMTVANGTTFGGGFKLTPQAQIDDGWLHVCLIEPVHPLKRIFKLPMLQQGNHHKMKETSFMKIKKIDIGPNTKVVAHLDGEFWGHPPFHVSVLPQKYPFRFPV